MEDDDYPPFHRDLMPTERYLRLYSHSFFRNPVRDDKVLEWYKENKISNVKDEKANKS